MTTYFDPGLIRPIELTEVRKQELACVMADAHRHIKRAAYKRHKNKKTALRQLRSDWRTGRCNLRNDWQARDSMQNLERIEHEVLAGYIRIAYSLCDAFYHAHSKFSVGVTMDDFIQEAAYAIFNAIYLYDGSREFSTFVYQAIKNQLVNFVRTDRSFSKMSRKIILWRINVVRLMNRQFEMSLSFEEALELYQTQRREKNLKPLTDDEKERIVASFNTTNVIRDDVMDESLFVADDGEKDKRLAMLRAAVNTDVLDEHEVEMVQMFLSGETGWQTRLAEAEGVTRMAISLRWQTAQNKLRRALMKAA